ncbi:unnamed protein product [Microthlaspi erraticum]|uniref:Uncharacterized protein n=1 Tax=Microthlaspi erraticum TaxID=1685480 RepID=A0A6D2JVY4_9BRAS|nr:unnamed protein product [Microthlaspi erraticum]
MRKPTIEGQLFYVEEMDQLADELLEELSTEDPLQVALTKDSSEGYVSSETDEYKKLLDTFRPVPNILSLERLDRPVCEVMAVSSIKNSIESSFEQTNSIELGAESKEQAQGDWSELKAPKVDLKPLPEGLRSFGAFWSIWDTRSMEGLGTWKQLNWIRKGRREKPS